MMSRFRYALILPLIAGVMLGCGIFPSASVTRRNAAAPAPSASQPAGALDLAGKPADPLAPADLSRRRATVLLFVATDCPISNGYAPAVHRLCSAYTPQGVTFCLVYPDADLSATEAKKHHDEYGYPCPAVLDPTHTLVKRTGVSVTPEVAVFNHDGAMVYRGRIDDLYADYPRGRHSPSRYDLKEVLEAITHDKAIAPRTTRAVGCPISD
jgi:Redoxin